MQTEDTSKGKDSKNTEKLSDQQFRNMNVPLLEELIHFTERWYRATINV